MQNKIPPFEDINNAHKRIRKQINRTPVHTSTTINEIVDVELFFKCENLQKTGSFKFRGASNAVLQIDKQEASNGVGTHSSGNHAAALALAAKTAGIKAHVVMPKTSNPSKIKAAKSYNANITFCEPSLDSREETYKEISSKTNAIFIHPSSDSRIICGQGTAAKELLEDYPDLDVIIAPVGGGGLISGTAIAAKNIKKEIRVYGAEPQMADDAYRSFKQGFLIPVDRPNTIADGLLTSLSLLTFKIINEYLDDIVTTKEDTIVKAMRLIWERMKLVAEPSAAVALAAIMDNRFVFKSKKVGIILSGGNINLNELPFTTGNEI
ncbi:MAG: pyridoxal-phosphate dependent enzyme [Bacteroidales bacterium]